MLLLLATPVLGRCLMGWLASAPARASSPLGALLLATASPAPEPHLFSQAVLGPIVVAAIAAVGTLGVAWLNAARARVIAPPAADPPTPLEEPGLTTDGRVLVLEANLAAWRREQAEGLAAVVESVDRLCRRFEEHLDRGTGRIPAQRTPAD